METTIIFRVLGLGFRMGSDNVGVNKRMETPLPVRVLIIPPKSIPCFTTTPPPLPVKAPVRQVEALRRQ